MILTGKFRLLGVEESAMNSEKRWFRVVLAQGTNVQKFYVHDDTVAKVVRSIPEAAEIIVEVQINVTSKGAFFTLLTIEEVAEK